MLRLQLALVIILALIAEIDAGKLKKWRRHKSKYTRVYSSYLSSKPAYAYLTKSSPPTYVHRKKSSTHPVVEVEKESVLDKIKTHDDLSILLAALEATGLDEALDDSEATLTLFAPTNEAFAALIEDLGVTPEELLADSELVSPILLYHVVGDQALKSTKLTDGQEVTTLQGGTLTITISGHMVTIVGMSSEAAVEKADIKAGHSIIHKIDAVLLF
eukprot:TRINITY_DN5032_c0_g3_i2.p1 TRINITY_DN5032_c0_g3~~TRINITY_DN5032_c0_g3_i2.p1  ORF type:complete len:216 (-),score=46.21 TRINITY_DN5032_c0_g3_i2:351-998(-)